MALPYLKGRLRPSEYFGDFGKALKYIFKPGKRKARWQTGQTYQVKDVGRILVKDITFNCPRYRVYYELVGD